MGSVSVCGPNSNSIWKSACSPSRKPTPILESVPVARIVRPISRNCSSRVDSVRTGRAQARLEKAKHARPVKVPRAFASRDKTFFFFFFFFFMRIEALDFIVIFRQTLTRTITRLPFLRNHRGYLSLLVGYWSR